MQVTSIWAKGSSRKICSREHLKNKHWLVNNSVCVYGGGGGGGGGGRGGTLHPTRTTEIYPYVQTIAPKILLLFNAVNVTDMRMMRDPYLNLFFS